MKSLSRVRLSATPWTVAYQAPLSTVFSRQKYWCGLPFPSPGDLPNPGIEPGSPTLQADALPSEPPGKLSNDITDIKWLGKSLGLKKKKMRARRINIKFTVLLTWGGMKDVTEEEG